MLWQMVEMVVELRIQEIDELYRTKIQKLNFYIVFIYLKVLDDRLVFNNTGWIYS